MLTAPEPMVADEVVQLLLVDDQPRNLEALEVMLAPTGCQLVRAQSANEALLALLDSEFAAIVLDIRMPGMDGLELAELIKERKRTRHVPILFLTAHLLEEGDVLRGYSTGAVDYLTKPVKPDILRSKIAVFVDLFRKTRALAKANGALEREIAERQRVEETLRRTNQELELRVQERAEALLRANAELRKNEDRLREADRRKDEFIAALGHELRNPLAPVRTAVEILRLQDPADPELQRARGVIDRQVQQMSHLIDDLLDVSRITRNSLVLRKERVELAGVVANAVETSRPSIEESHHTLTVTLPKNPVILSADPIRLGQVLSNLLNNAAKYTDRGGRIELIAELRGLEVFLRVRDNGIGIAPEMLPRVFELFIQADQTPDRAKGGLGIGLTLVRRLVEMHEGSVQAQSDGPGKGSEFVVRLPVLQGVSKSFDHANQDAPSIDRTPRLRVLIVDDNRDAAEMLGIMLGAWGHDTRTAHDGLAAIEEARSFLPHLVLLDIGLPKLDGYGTARRIRQESWGKDMRLVAVTGWGQESDRREGLEAGFDSHFVKPVDPAALRKVIAELVR